MKILIVGDDGQAPRLMRLLAAGKEESGEVFASPMRLLSAASDKSAEDHGWSWNVQIIEAGVDKDREAAYPLAVLHAAAPLYEGAPVFLHSASQHLDPSKRPRFGPSVRDKVGWLSDVKANEKGLVGKWNIYKSEPNLRTKVMDSFEREGARAIGLSHDITSYVIMKNGLKEATKIVKVNSVDVVHNPIGGGKLIDLAAAAKAGHKEATMEWLQRLLAALKGMRPDLAGKIDPLAAKGDTVAEAEVMGLLAASMEKPADVAAMITQLTAAMKEGTGKPDDAKALLAAAEAKFTETTRLLACSSQLSEALAADAVLPAAAKARIKAQFDGKVFETATLQAALKFEKEYLDVLQAAGFVDLPGGERAQVFGQLDRMQAASDKMFGVEPRAELKSEVPFEGLRAAYVRLTGDTAIRGVLDPAQLQRLHAAGFDSSTWSYVLGNSLARSFTKDFLEHPDFGLSLLISNERNAKDFRTLEAVKVAYFNDLPTNDPEANDWPDLGTLSDEEISYALSQRGGIIGISRKMIINDDIGSVTKVLSRLPRAARWTRAKRAWTKLIGNATYKGDGKAVFHVDHANLGTTALAKAELLVILTAMRAQTAPGSGNKIYIPRKSEVLVIPTDLWGTAVGINDTPPVAGTANELYQYFGVNKERIFECPFMTDVTDYMVLGDAKNHDTMEIAYLNGQREPEMLVANNPTGGQLFYADKAEYKIRMEDEVELLDYRNMYKEVVAG